MAAPDYRNETPSNGSSGNARDGAIGAEVYDADLNLAGATVKFWVNDTLAWLGAVPAGGWSGTRTALSDGYRYLFTPSLELPPGVQSARVYGEDDDGNSVSKTWSFTTKTILPEVDPAEVAGELNTGLDLRLATDTHDLVVEDYDLQLIAGVDEVAQHLGLGLKLFLGEWYLDEESGMPYYRDVFIAAPKSRIVEALFRQEILSDEDIERIESFSMEINRGVRKLDVDFEAVSSVGVVNVSSVFP